MSFPADNHTPSDDPYQVPHDEPSPNNQLPGGSLLPARLILFAHILIIGLLLTVMFRPWGGSLTMQLILLIARTVPGTFLLVTSWFFLPILMWLSVRRIDGLSLNRRALMMLCDLILSCAQLVLLLPAV